MKLFKIHITDYNSEILELKELLDSLKLYNNKILTEDEFSWEVFSIEIEQKVEAINIGLEPKIELVSTISFDGDNNLIHLLYNNAYKLIISCTEFTDS